MHDQNYADYTMDNPQGCLIRVSFQESFYTSYFFRKQVSRYKLLALPITFVRMCAMQESNAQLGLERCLRQYHIILLRQYRGGLGYISPNYYVKANSLSRIKSISGETRSGRILHWEIAFILQECDLHGECKSQRYALSSVNLDLRSGISRESHDHNNHEINTVNVHKRRW